MSIRLTLCAVAGLVLLQAVAVAAPAPFARSQDEAARLAAAGFRLENARIALALDRRTGGILAIENKLSGERVFVDDPGFAAEVGTGETPGTLGVLTPANCTPAGAAQAPDGVAYTFVKGPVTLTLTYHLLPEDAFARKQLTVHYAGPGRYNVRRLEMLDWALLPRPASAIPYYGFLRRGVFSRIDDGEDPLPDTSTAFFLRGPAGGIYTALTCDFVQMKEDAGRYRSTYWPGYILDAGTDLTSETALVGVYRRKGPFFEPYQPSAQLGDFHQPNVDARLDRGEIEAVQEAVERFIKPDVSYVVVNGWGVGLPRLIEDADAEAAFKHGIDTLVKVPGLQGLHFVHSWCGLTREFREQGTAMAIQPNPHADAVFQYARSKGMGLSMFIGTSNNYPLQQEGGPVTASGELLSLDENGRRRPGNIAFSRQYADFIYETVRRLREKYPQIIGLTYDFLAIQPDYDTSHGYLPGRASLYPQYANLRDTNRRLRKAFPDLMLRGQIGWMWLGPWLAENMALCHNATDHGCARQRNFLDFSIDHHFANNIRLSNFFTRNCKMYPAHKMNSNSIHNGSQFRAWDYGAWEYAVLSQMATGEAFGMLHNLPDEQNGEIFREEDGRFFRKWLQWHREHRDFYRHARDLFGEPRPDGVDGHAYGNGTESILFLCNPTYRTHQVAVPVGEDLFLPEGRRYTVRERYPEERYRVGPDGGVFAHGSLFVADVPPQRVMVFEVKPDDAADALLLGVGGELAAGPAGVAARGVSGPAASERLLAVRLPRGYRGPAVLSLDGRPLPVTRVGDLLLGRVRFDGEPGDPEVSDWHAEREEQGTRLRVRARFHVPASARQALAAQKLPVAKPFAGPEWLQRTAWLGWDRFIIFLPILPPGVDADTLRGDAWKRLEADFPIRATLNGRPAAVHSNLIGQGGNGQRWSGFFIDASAEVEYGKTNELLLEMPNTSDDRLRGIYLPNLPRETVSAWAPLPAPASLALRRAPGTATVTRASVARGSTEAPPSSGSSPGGSPRPARSASPGGAE